MVENIVNARCYWQSGRISAILPIVPSCLLWPKAGC